MMRRLAGFAGQAGGQGRRICQISEDTGCTLAHRLAQPGAGVHGGSRAVVEAALPQLSRQVAEAVGDRWHDPVYRDAGRN
jgi:hypothetical protein